MSDRQEQRAGDNSQLIQAGTLKQADVINNFNIIGVDENKAREIALEVSKHAIAEYTSEASDIAQKRINVFSDMLIPRIEKIEHGLEAFAAPAFQVLMKKAQITAACTEREGDYKILSELLAHRIENREDRKIATSISKAVEIVDQIDDDALCALTVCHCINYLTPITGGINDGLAVLNSMFEKLNYMELPSNMLWLGHLEELGTIRSSQFSRLTKIVDLYYNKLSGYVCTGLKKDSEQLTKAIDILKSNSLPLAFLVPHDLLEDYFRIPVPNKEQIKTCKYSPNYGRDWVSLNTTQINALEEIWGLYEVDNNLKERVRQKFFEKWDSFETLAKMKKWYDNIPYGFSITSIGMMLAHANAQKYDYAIPDFKYD